MSVSQRVDAIVQDVSLVVEGRQAQFRHLHGMQHVIGRLEHAKFCSGLFGGVSQDIQKLFVLKFFLHVVFLDALCLLETLRLFPGDTQTVHFGPQSHKLLRRGRPRLALHLPQYSSIVERVQGSSARQTDRHRHRHFYLVGWMISLNDVVWADKLE